MKQKRDLSMWLKSIKENKASYFYWGYLGIIGVIFYLMNIYTPLYSDDWHYCFIFGTTHPIESICDILRSQYTHYFHQNGRFIPHFIIQYFDGIAGKYLFNIANGIIFVVFLYLLTITITPNKKKHLFVLSLIVILIFFLLPGFKECFLWMSGACNYLWSATILLTFNLLLKKNFRNKYIFPLLFLFGIISGWTHEGLVIGLIIGYFAYYIFHINQLNRTSTSLLLGFFLGALFLIFSPGSIHRALGNEGSASIKLTSYFFST